MFLFKCAGARCDWQAGAHLDVVVVRHGVDEGAQGLLPLHLGLGRDAHPTIERGLAETTGGNARREAEDGS